MDTENVVVRVCVDSLLHQTGATVLEEMIIRRPASSQAGSLQLRSYLAAVAVSVVKIIPDSDDLPQYVQATHCALWNEQPENSVIIPTRYSTWLTWCSTADSRISPCCPDSKSPLWAPRS